MVAMYINDPNDRFVITRNSAESAEYVIRTARTLAEGRFQKWRVNALSNSNHNRKGVRGNGSKSGKDIFDSTLVAINGVSENKAKAISAEYKSVGDLQAKYMVLNEEEGRLLLKDMQPIGYEHRLHCDELQKKYGILES